MKVFSSICPPKVKPHFNPFKAQPLSNTLRARHSSPGSLFLPFHLGGSHKEMKKKKKTRSPHPAQPFRLDVKVFLKKPFASRRPDEWRRPTRPEFSLLLFCNKRNNSSCCPDCHSVNQRLPHSAQTRGHSVEHSAFKLH